MNYSRPDTPLLVSPVDGTTNISLMVQLLTGPFYDPNNDPHLKTQWQISLQQPVFEEPYLVIDEVSSSQLTSWLVPSDCILEKNQQYFWRALFFDGNEWSLPSNANSFWTGDFGIQFEGGIDIEAIIGPEEELKLGDEFLDSAGDLRNSDTVKAFKSKADSNVQIGMIAYQGCTIEKISSKLPEDIVIDNDVLDGEIPEMPYGIIDFELTVPEKGDVAIVSIYFSEPIPEDFIWWKYDPKLGFYDYAASAYPVPVLSVSSDRKSVALQLKDGGYGDLIEKPDGKIFDPSGVGGTLDSASSSSGGSGGSCFIKSLMF